MADSTLAALSANTDPLDDDIQYIVDDPSGTPTDKKMALRHNRWFGLSIPYFTSAAYYLSHPAGLISSVAVTANRLYVHPVIVPYRRAFTAIACNSNSGATGNVRMGIYNSVFSAANGWAVGTLVAETASTAVASGLTTAAITATLDPGVYWLASVFDGTPTLRTFAVASGNIMGIDLANGPNLSSAGFYSAHTYGALPDLTGVSQTGAAVVAVGIK